MIEPLLVGLGGSIGASLRYAVGLALDSGEFPLDTLAVNVLGSFVLGLVVFIAPGDHATALVGIGACGAFTTYSSFSYETVRLYERGRPWRAVASAALNLAGALAGIGLAWVIGGVA